MASDTSWDDAKRWFRRRSLASRVLIALLFLLYVGIGIASPLASLSGLSSEDTYVLSNEPTTIDGRVGDHLRFERAEGSAPTTCMVEPLVGEPREVVLRYTPYVDSNGGVDLHATATASAQVWWTGEAAVACAENSRVDLSASDAYIAGWLGLTGVMMATVPLTLGLAGLAYASWRKLAHPAPRGANLSNRIT